MKVKTSANVRGVTSDMGVSIVGTLVVLALFGFGMYGLVMGVPYLYHRSIVSWAGRASDPNTLTGVWVGYVSTDGTEDYGDYMRRGGHGVPPSTVKAHTAMKMTVGVDFTWGVTKISGGASTCHPGDSPQLGSYHGEPLLHPGQFRLAMRGPDPAQFTTLAGSFIPGALTVSWPSTGGFITTGVLHKGSVQEFEQLCANLGTR